MVFVCPIESDSEVDRLERILVRLCRPDYSMQFRTSTEVGSYGGWDGARPTFTVYDDFPREKFIRGQTTTRGTCQFRTITRRWHMTAWLFQGNPQHYTLNSYLRDQKLVTWHVKQSRFAEEMQPGDQVFI